MITTQITVPGYTPPSRLQNQDDLNTSMELAFSHMSVTLPSELTSFIAETNSLATELNQAAANVNSDAIAAAASAAAAMGHANVTVYSDLDTYNRFDAVLANDGGIYRCMVDDTIGDNPVGSITGAWYRVSFAEPTVLVRAASFQITPFIPYLIDSSGVDTIDATLTPNPVPGQRVHLGDYAGTWAANSPILRRNGKKIMGTEDDLRLNHNTFVTFVYIDEPIGWRLIK